METLALLPANIVQIYNTPGRTRDIASKFKISRSTVARIKGGTGIYRDVILDYQAKTLRHLWRQDYGYDIISNYYPPPWGKENHTPEKIQGNLKNAS